MKEILSDIVRQVAPLFTTIRVTGGDDSTKVEAYTEDKSLFLVARLKASIPEFAGEFGIGSLQMLNGLLNFSSYKTDDAKFFVHRTSRDDLEFVSEFQFKDNKGAGTRFKTMSPRMVGEQATIKNISWELTFRPTKAKIAEIAQISNLLSEVDKMFGLRVADGTLFLTIGGDSEVKHAATVALTDENIDNKLVNANPWLYNTAQFLSILKNAGSECNVLISSRGVIGIVVETDQGEYTFYMRGKPE